MGAKTETHFLSDSKRNEESKKEFETIETNKGGTSKVQFSEQKAPKTDFSYGNSEFNAALGKVKDAMNQKDHEGKPSGDGGKGDQQGLSGARSTIKKSQGQLQQPSEPQSNLTRTMKDSKSTGQGKAAGTQNSQRSNEFAVEPIENEFSSGGTNKNVKDLKNSSANRNSPTTSGVNEKNAGGNSGLTASFGATGLASLQNPSTVENMPQHRSTKPLVIHDDEIEDFEDI